MNTGAATMSFPGPYFLGIDPGTSGGISLLDADGRVMHVSAMPDDDRAIFCLLAPHGRDVRAALERVWSSPGWGHVGAFTFGANYGALRMALAAYGVPVEDVLPRTWQKVMGVSYPKAAKRVKGAPPSPPVRRDKNITKTLAQELFPGTRVTHAIADCLLIAEYKRRTTL